MFLHDANEKCARGFRFSCACERVNERGGDVRIFPAALVRAAKITNRFSRFVERDVERVPQVVRVPRVLRRARVRLRERMTRVLMISKQRLTQPERRPRAIVVGAHLYDASRVERRTPRIAFEQNFGELTMREDRFFAPVFRARCESMKQRQHAKRIRSLERDFDVALQLLAFGRVAIESHSILDTRAISIAQRIFDERAKVA